MSPALGTLARRAFRAAWVLALLAVALWIATNLVAGRADGLPGPALEDCGLPGERAETCTAGQLLWEDRELIVLAVAVAATAAAAIAAVTAATAAVVRDVLARRRRA